MFTKDANLNSHEVASVFSERAREKETERERRTHIEYSRIFVWGRIGRGNGETALRGNNSNA